MLVILDKLNFYLYKFWQKTKPYLRWLNLLLPSLPWRSGAKRGKLGLVSFVILASLVLVVWVAGTHVAQADMVKDIKDGMINFIIGIIMAMAGWFIKLTFFILKFVIEVGGYNGFIDSPAVTVGWVMVRDITNMFFVVVLLIISFGTILGLEQYEYKKLLVKLLMAAVIVNFSRIICGIIIDVAQVVMITFINGIAATASGNMTTMFGVGDIFTLSQNDNLSSQGFSGTGEMFLAAVASITFAAIMMVTMLTFLFLMLARMITLWILIVLSPFAFVLNVLPQTQKYAGQWWSEFGGNVVAGPIIAFFLWLSFVTVGAGNARDHIAQDNPNSFGEGSTNPKETSTGITKIMTWEKMANFAIAIGMLLAGAKMAQQLGAAGGSMMGKAGEFGKKVAMIASGATAARWAGRGVVAGGKKAGAYGLGLAAAPFKRAGRGIKAEASKMWTKGWVEPRALAASKRMETAYGKGAKVEMGKTSKEIQDMVMARNVALIEARDTEATEEERKLALEQSEVLRKQLEQKGYEVGEKQGRTELKEAEPLAKRAWARAGLLFAPAAFKEEYVKDQEAGAKYAQEQIEHLISTSKTPMGKFKTEAEADLMKLKKTGEKIKARKIADVLEKRGGVDAAIAKEILAGKSLSELEASGSYTDREISDYKRLTNADKSGVQAEQINATLLAEENKRLAEAKGKEYGTGKGMAREQLAAEAKAESKQAEELLAEKRNLAELQQIKKLLMDKGKGEKIQSVITNTRAELANLKEMGELASEKSGLLARAADYAKNGEEDKAEAFIRRAGSLDLEKSRDATKNLSGDEIIARGAFLEQQLVKARGSGDDFETDKLTKKLMVLRSNAMTGPAWISMALDRALEEAIGISAEEKQKMTTQQYSLSLDLGKKIGDASEVTAMAHELEGRLGSGESQQAFIRDRKLSVESALGKSRQDVAGTIDTEFKDGKVNYNVVDEGDRYKQMAKADAEHKSWSLKVGLQTSAGAPISNRGRDSTGKLVDNALVACAEEFELLNQKLAGLTANQYSSIPQVIEDLKNASERVRQQVVADLAANKGTNAEFLRKLKEDLKIS